MVKKILVYFLTCVIVPVSFFVLIELGLRFVEYGYPAGFFIKQKINNSWYLVNNFKFSWRFFPKPVARLSASVTVPEQKSKDAFRVFIIGESAAMGDPDPAYSFSRYLQAMLEVSYPDKKIEIYNTALTAINSNVLVPIVEDCMELQPDLFVIYAGNNEVIGPYGLSEALSSFTSHRSVIKAKIKLSETRIGQVLAELNSKPTGNEQEWRGMEMFMNQVVKSNDPRLEIIYNHFENNLKEICDRATAKGAKIILSTVVTNTMDCAPFLSLHEESLKGSQYSQWQNYFDNGINYQNDKNYEAAIQEFLKAFKLDSVHAELNFRLGQSYFYLKNIPGSVNYLTAARDLDALRFRADSRINSIIRKVAATYANDKVMLLDAEKEMTGLAGNQSLGKNIFYEHVHLNPKGNYQLASLTFNLAAKALALPPPKQEVTFDFCQKRLAFTAFDQMRIDDINVARLKAPPFSKQFTNQRDISETQQRIDSVTQSYDSTFRSSALLLYDNQIRNHPTDWFLKLSYLKFLHAFDYHKKAFDQACSLYNYLPYEYLSNVNLGVTSIALEDFPLAENYLGKAIKLNPYFTEAYRVMAMLYESKKEFYRVESLLSKGGANVFAVAEFHNRAGVVFAKERQLDSAISYFSKAVKINPNLIEAQQNLVTAKKKWEDRIRHPASPEFSSLYNKANNFFRQGNFTEAIELYQKALRLRPSFADAYNNLGICFIQLARPEEALIQFGLAIKADTDFPDAYVNMAFLLNDQLRYREAIPFFQKAFELKPNKELLQGLAVAYSASGDETSAIKCRQLETNFRGK